MSNSVELTRSPETIYIKPSTGLTALNLRDIWIYRELIFFMIWRDIKVGTSRPCWGPRRPLSMVTMPMLISSLARSPRGRPKGSLSYFLLYCALPWGLFYDGTEQRQPFADIQPEHDHEDLLPPACSAAIFGAWRLVDFAIAFLILIVLMIYYKITPTAAVWLLPIFLLLAIVTALRRGPLALSYQYANIAT